ncbi:DUF1343 domain-containing protein [Bacteroidales bacterium OttesenSCG-928-A17]|nr:DUF1343 domain-containing protein [Bacteroidales bacterium OttesenSCG-928-A17]
MRKVGYCLILCLFPLSVFAQKESVKTGAESFALYYPLLKDKRIAVFTNHTGLVGNKHLVDFLLEQNLNIKVILAPEHGFRGTSDAGEKVNDEIDKKTGIPVYSLYKNKTGKPGKEIMDQIDLILFDIQDVGLRFYTYYISMYHLMDACADYDKPMILLDRPNPNGFYIDGPILDMKYKSGVGYLPIPVVHGMTLGELAQMINGEKWLPNKKQCKLYVIPCENYTHQTKYHLPVPPSPNLPNMKSVYLYPSVCLFEGTKVSLGRGTSFPFQVYGHPDMKKHTFSFTPKSVPGAKNPPLLNRTCYGVDLRNISDEEIYSKGIDLEYIIDAYRNLDIGAKFFTSFFENLIGVNYVRKMIIAGKSNDEIKGVWAKDVEKFREQRRPYLLYSE